MRLPVVGHPPCKVFWSTDRPYRGCFPHHLLTDGIRRVGRSPPDRRCGLTLKRLRRCCTAWALRPKPLFAFLAFSIIARRSATRQGHGLRFAPGTRLAQFPDTLAALAAANWVPGR